VSAALRARRAMCTRLAVGIVVAGVVATSHGALAQPAPGGAAPDGEPSTTSPDPAAPPPADDLAKAADAAAEVASVSATPPTQASSPDIDLSALGLDPSTTDAVDDKLNIYGFADIGFDAFSTKRDVPLTLNHTRSFLVGNFNLYLAKNLSRRARSLAEVRFTFLPNGSQNADGSFVDATAYDPTNFGRPVQWGGVVIERAYMEYDLTDWLTIRGGHWLTPYGIWNIDHGSPVIIGVRRPYIIGEQFFPEHQTGLDLFGSRHLSDYKLSYHATLSNGRGGSEAQADQDNELAVGGRVELETPSHVRLGASFYHGRYTALATTPGALAETYLETAYGGDIQYDRDGLHLQGEAIARERHYNDGKRAATAAGFTPDSRDVGLYALAGYRFDKLWNVMPFAVYEYYKPGVGLYFDEVQDVSVGLNVRPMSSVVLKAQAVYAWFPGGGLLGGNPVTDLTLQAAWVF
jgi:hypothetical protein